jgi:hypothetical protein
MTAAALISTPFALPALGVVVFVIFLVADYVFTPCCVTQLRPHGELPARPVALIRSASQLFVDCK